MAASLLKTVRAEFKKGADPARAAQMQAYMKSEMPYHGVAMPVVRSLCKELFAPLQFDSAEQWRETVLSLWHAAEFREERYAALILTGLKAAKPFQTMDSLPVYEELIVTGAWWDFVDDVAAHRLSPLLTKYPAPMKKAMRAWSHSNDLWKRRSAIICQGPLKAKTDLELLYACIEPAIDSKEFFLRKAIGWALRDYAKVDPDEVVRYVRENEDRLSGLSKREALKHVNKAGADEAA